MYAQKMKKSFRISLDDGSVRPSEECAPLENRPSWTEAMLEGVLRLAPEGLELGKAELVIWKGGSAQTGPDQLYLDRFGRSRVIELKNEAADLKAIAQVLFYADVYRTPPIQQIARRTMDRDLSRRMALGAAT